MYGGNVAAYTRGMTAVLIGAAAWLVILGVLAWQLRRRRELTTNEPEELFRGLGAMPMTLARRNRADEDDSEA